MDAPYPPDNSLTEHILRARAQTLAQVPTRSTSVQGKEHIFFRLGEAGYAIPVQFVREVYPLGNYTPLPSTPPCIVGLVNIRGRLWSIIDLRPLLQLAHTPPHPDALLLLLHSTTKGAEIALLTDTVVEIRHATSEMTPVVSEVGTRSAAWIGGVDKDMNIVLDPPLLLADPRFNVGEADEPES